MLWRNGRSGMLLALICLLLGTVIPAQAIDTSWIIFGDREWRIGTDVWEPGHEVTYYTSGSIGIVPHKASYRNEVRRTGSTWATRRYTLIGEMERFQAKNSTWWGYPDVQYTTYQPQSTSSTTSYFWFYNPNGTPYQSSIPVSSNWNQCESAVTAYDWTGRYQRGPIKEIHAYRVLQSGG